MSSVYLITGASGGLGLEMAKAALAAGHKVIGTVRSRSKSAQAVSQLEQAGASILEFDASHSASAIAAVAKTAVSMHGRIDVVINNGAYSLLGAIEDLEPAQSQAQIQTNFFGPLFLIQALLPGMRAQKSGTIVNISSVAGLDGLPSCGLYAASKFALEGLSESLSREVAPFGLRVLLVNPGAFRTNFLSAHDTPEIGLSEAYRGGPVENVMKTFEEYNGKQPGDPVKGAKMIVDTIDGGCKVDGRQVLRLLIGGDSLGRMDNKITSITKDRAACAEYAKLASY